MRLLGSVAIEAGLPLGKQRNRCVLRSRQSSQHVAAEPALASAALAAADRRRGLCLAAVRCSWSNLSAVAAEPALASAIRSAAA